MFLTLALLAAAPVTQAAPPAPEEKKICRRPATTGTRMAAKPVCRTKAEWAEYNRSSENAVSRRERDTMNTGGYNAGIDSGRFN